MPSATPTKTLVLTDLINNLEAEKVNPIIRPFLRPLGVRALNGSAHFFLKRSLNVKRSDVQRATAELVALEPDRVVLSHGQWFCCDGAQALEVALKWTS